jgi:hypothetical protein
MSPIAAIHRVHLLRHDLKVSYAHTGSLYDVPLLYKPMHGAMDRRQRRYANNTSDFPERWRPLVMLDERADRFIILLLNSRRITPSDREEKQSLLDRRTVLLLE